jgi:hypothetical protein
VQQKDGFESHTNLHWCIFDQKEHGSQTQKGFHRLGSSSSWFRSCWSSGSCRGKRHEYGIIDNQGEERHPWVTLALACFPDDSSIWEASKYQHWKNKNLYFGPRQGSSNVQYVWRDATSLTRRCKSTNTVSISRMPSPDQYQWDLFPKLACDDSVAAHQFLKQLDTFILMENEVGVIPVGILNQETVSVDYYSSTAVGAAPLKSISL